MNHQQHTQEKEFDQWVRKKYNIYNGIFLNLPFQDIGNYGAQIPVMYQFLKKGLDGLADPLHLLDDYFRMHTEFQEETEKIYFMLRIIRYVERQVVLYDSIEDAAFPHIHERSENRSLGEYLVSREPSANREQILNKLNTFGIRLVFTAHPTQFYPPSILEIIGRLKSCIEQNDLNGTDTALQQLGMTPMSRPEKPTPQEEARNIIYYLRYVYYDTMGEYYTKLQASMGKEWLDNPGLVRLGFWPGGDRDGNPFVTAATTLDVADELRMTLMKCYYQDLKSLEKRLTFKGVEQVIDQIREAIYPAMFDRHITPGDRTILDSLLQIRDIIIKKYNSLYLHELDLVINKVRIFGSHFATLDIRQNHEVHKQLIESILAGNGRIEGTLDGFGKQQLVDILMDDNFKADLTGITDELHKDTIANIRQLRTIQQKNGEAGCHRYIISNSEDIFSVLFVYALFRWCGYGDEEITFDIVPLFETMKGMENASAIMEELHSIPAYRSHVQRRNNTQTIMLGFSDGTKDGGYLKANWSIFKTKEVLSELHSRLGIDLIFFDGRGGPPARGGGKSHRFYAAQSHLIANKEIQLTIQGQTITSRYGTREQFMHNCDQLIAAGIFRELHGEKLAIAPSSRDLIERLSEISFEKYRDLKNHPKFLPYLETRSTLKYYSRANIGSRPAKRGGDKKLEFSDLRAISFVGSWSQLKQNVPGYYGLGTALSAFEKEGKLGDLQQLFREVPVFKALVLNSMMSLSKCNFNLTAYMAKDEEFSDFWKMLHAEYLLSREMVLKISGYRELMEEEPVTRSSIGVRERIVLPLLVIQQYALQKILKGSDFKEQYEKIVTRSLYGNINASRNSA